LWLNNSRNPYATLRKPPKPVKELSTMVDTAQLHLRLIEFGVAATMPRY
jgi:hypothetical protein